MSENDSCIFLHPKSSTDNDSMYNSRALAIKYPKRIESICLSLVENRFSTENVRLNSNNQYRTSLVNEIINKCSLN